MALLTVVDWSCCPVDKQAPCSSWWGLEVRQSGWGGRCSQGSLWTPGYSVWKQWKHCWHITIPSVLYFFILSNQKLKFGTKLQYLCRSKWLENLQSKERHKRAYVLSKPGSRVQFWVTLVVTPWVGSYSEINKKKMGGLVATYCKNSHLFTEGVWCYRKFQRNHDTVS